MDISVRRTGPFGVEDRSWLASAFATTATRTITLNVASFTAGTHYPNGYIRSGTLLARITGGPAATVGTYGPYAAGGANGLGTPAGYLFNSTPVRSGGPNVGAPLLEFGAINVSNLPLNSGLDAAARTALVRFSHRD